MNVFLRLSFLFLILTVAISNVCDGKPAPDSAGLVPQPPGGLAYGGIPYGSISGQLSLYFGDYEPLVASSTSSKENLIDSLQLL